MGGEQEYENLANCWIKIVPTDGSSTNVVFTFLHTERNHDKIRVYDGTDANTVLSTLSGDVLTPYVVQVSSGKDVLISFEADGTEHTTGSTLQLGFNATFVGGDSCFNDCSGRGTCESTGRCTCNEKSYLAHDCSVVATQLTEDNTVDITDLPPGEWAYFYFELTSNKGWLVDLQDVGDASSDPYLMGRRNAAPRLYVMFERVVVVSLTHFS